MSNELENRIAGLVSGTLSGSSRQGTTKASIVKAATPKTDHSPKSLHNSTGESDAGQGLVDPPYDLEVLAKIRERSNALTPMVDAYKTNIAGFGFDFQYNFDFNSKEVDESIKKKALEEWVVLENFYKYCNFDSSFSDLLMRVIDDREFIGFGALEILTGKGGKPTGFEYVPAQTLKISMLHRDPQLVKLDTVDQFGKVTTVAFEKRFRRYCQEVENTRVWFKEFGDPRRMSRSTGAYELESQEDGTELKTDIPPEDEASSLIIFSIPVPYSVYGLPRWVGNLMGIQGSRKAEELNYRYFVKGRHTPLAILVNNGSLTQSSMDVIQSYVNNVEGVENAFGYLVLEAAGFDDEDPNTDSTSRAEVKIQPLLDAIQNDALFQEYDQNNRDKLRETMRLAPIYTGASKDYTRATADVAKSITEEQVFQPERKALGSRINRLVNQALGIRYVDMILSAPDITNKRELAETVGIYTRAGAITPNMVLEAVSQLLGTPLEQFPETWGNLPINIVAELVKKDRLSIDDLMVDSIGGSVNEPTQTATGDPGAQE